MTYHVFVQMSHVFVQMSYVFVQMPFRGGYNSEMIIGHNYEWLLSMRIRKLKIQFCCLDDVFKIQSLAHWKISKILKQYNWLLLEILGNMYVVIICFPVSDLIIWK